jgi:hypothetical protein
MAKVQRVRFLRDCFEAGALKYARGCDYPLTPETLAQVRVHGHAELLELEFERQAHEAETAAAHAAWNAANARTIAVDPALRSAANPAALLVAERLKELRA